jgi:hypothetical protein
MANGPESSRTQHSKRAAATARADRGHARRGGRTQRALTIQVTLVGILAGLGLLVQLHPELRAPVTPFGVATLAGLAGLGRKQRPTPTDGRPENVSGRPDDNTAWLRRLNAAAENEPITPPTGDQVAETATNDNDEEQHHMARNDTGGTTQVIQATDVRPSASFPAIRPDMPRPDDAPPPATWDPQGAPGTASPATGEHPTSGLVLQTPAPMAAADLKAPVVLLDSEGKECRLPDGLVNAGKGFVATAAAYVAGREAEQARQSAAGLEEEAATKRREAERLLADADQAAKAAAGRREVERAADERCRQLEGILRALHNPAPAPQAAS